VSEPTARRHRVTVDSDKPIAPMSWMQRLKRVLTIEIETGPDGGGKLRVIAYGPFLPT